MTIRDPYNRIGRNRHKNPIGLVNTLASSFLPYETFQLVVIHKYYILETQV